MANNITFKSNTVSQRQSTNPNKYWGNCVALYGGKDIRVIDTTCANTANGGVKFAETFGGKFGSDSNIIVQNMQTDEGKPDCYQQSEVGARSGIVNSCPRIDSGNSVCMDPCFVHRNCGKGISYSGSSSSSMGKGWYCNDNVLVGETTDYDLCCIHPGCPSA